MRTASYDQTLVQPSQTDVTWAMMAYLGQFALSVLAPIVVRAGRPHTHFVQRHATQALNLGLTFLCLWAAWFALWLTVPVPLWVPMIYTAVAAGALIRAAIAASRMEYFRVPAVLAWPLAKQRQAR